MVSETNLEDSEDFNKQQEAIPDLKSMQIRIQMQEKSEDAQKWQMFFGAEIWSRREKMAKYKTIDHHNHKTSRTCKLPFNDQNF